MRIKLRGIFVSVDKYNRAHLLFLSRYHYSWELDGDFARNSLKNYDSRFKERIQEKKQPEDIDEVQIKSPIKRDEYIVNLNKKIKYLNIQSELTSLDNLIMKEVIIDATLTDYEFLDKTSIKNGIKKKIIGWKITSGRIKETRTIFS